MKNILSLILIVFFNLNTAMADSNKAQPTLLFSNIVIPEAPPVAAVMVAYLNIENTSSAKQTITSIESPQFKRVEVHKMSMENGIMKMEQMKQLSLNAKQSIVLKSGGLHVMLINPIKSLRAGSSIELSFTLLSGELTTINTHVQLVNNDEHKNHH